MRRRRFKETLFRTLMAATVLGLGAAFLAVVGTVLVKGLGALSLAMLTEPPMEGTVMGQGGGIANAILGTLCLGAGGSAIALLIALPAALAMQREYARPWLARASRLVLDLLWGTPSIVYGVFGFVVMAGCGMRASLLGGTLTLALVMLPVMIRAMAEALDRVPPGLRECACALGANRSETALRVLLRQAVPGVATGFLLACGRGLGDTAALLFTAGYTDHLPGSLADPVASLPLAVFFQIATPVPAAQAKACAAALVLLVLVLALNLGARWLSRRCSRHVLK